MNIFDLLAKIESGEIKSGTIVYVDGDFFYNLIVIDKNLYVIQGMTKQLELLESQYIGRFIRDGVELRILKPTAPTINDIRERNGLPKIEEKKIPEKLGYFDLTKNKNEKDENGDDLELHYTGVADTFDDVYEKINEIIDYLDYLESKGE